jgi:hypothetical protein
MTTFKFRVRTNKGKPKTGAIVRFAGHRVESRRGKARLHIKVWHRGRHVARASRPGYGPARRVVFAR